MYCIKVSAVPFAGMIPTCIHSYVDGSFFRGSNRAGWSFVAVAGVIGDKYVLQGYSAGAVYEENMAYFCGDRLDNIAVESVSIFAALGFLLTVPSVNAVVHYDCAPAGESAAGDCILPDNVAQITRVFQCFVRFLKDRGAKIAFKHINGARRRHMRTMIWSPSFVARWNIMLKTLRTC